MKRDGDQKRFVLTLAASAVLALAGCGGGGSGDATMPSTPTTPTTPAATVQTISGVAASGAAFTDAIVTAYDSTGAVVGTSAAVGTDGTYSVTLANGAKAPFVLVAARALSTGEVQTLVSVAESASVTKANLTPVTTLVASRLSPSGNPARLIDEVKTGAAQLTPATVTAKVTEVKTILASLLQATGTAAVDPLKDGFSVNGTGYDRLLDSINVQIVPASPTETNIEVAVRQALPDGAQPAVVSFSSKTAAPAALPAVDANTLVATGTSTLIADLLKQLTACFALPLTDRVATGGTAAADIKASACKSAFAGNNPASYRSNGRVVAPGQSFSGIFNDASTGLVFDRGSYEFSRANGDVVLGYRTRDKAGNEAFDAVVARVDTDGKLKLIGNQYRFPGAVVASHQFREYITLNQSGYAFRSTGYIARVDNLVTSAGVPIFDRVEVTAPDGRIVVTLKPATGFSVLQLVKNGSTLGTNFIRLRAEYDSAPTAAPTVSNLEPNLYIRDDYSDAQMVALPAQAVWTFKYFLAGNSGTTPDETQSYRTTNRALSIAELKQQPLAQLTSSALTALKAADTTSTNGRLPLSTSAALAVGSTGSDGWTVPSGALPPTSVELYGRYTNASTSFNFNDATTVGTTVRSTSVRCAPASAADVHCTSGGFAAGAFGTGVNLNAKDRNGREFGHFYAMYKL